MNKLVVVESPTKARTLERFLGKDFAIKSSKGHIRDLPKSELGVDVEHDFVPQYVTIRGKGKVISEIKKATKSAKEIFLATDLDREGEAIAWHIAQVAGILQHTRKAEGKSERSLKRVVFHEITKSAIEQAFTNPRGLDFNLIDAQQARRVLDRLVGYKLSPLLWKKVRYGLSAGRVQSVVVRLIVEREREKTSFRPQVHFKIIAVLSPKTRPEEQFEAELKHYDDKPYERTKILNLFAGEYKITSTNIADKRQAEDIVKDLENETFIVKKVSKSEVRKSPAPPFTTASLQREASNYLHFSSGRTMRAAQNLYEEGYITYHRTDSVHLAEDFLKQARSYIKKILSEQFIPKDARYYQTKSESAQEAHEAIRPTDILKNPKKINLGKDEGMLYDLIWTRALACQMADAVFDSTKIEISAGKYAFEASGSVLKFEGFLKIYKRKRHDRLLPQLKPRDILQLWQLKATSYQTQSPPRYTEASLIRDLEHHGIGRPSTYAPIISLIQQRGYVSKRKQQFYPLDSGIVVNDLLVEHFPAIVDLQFTAQMEEDLDKIARGEITWVPVVHDFYGPFEKQLEKKMDEIKKEEVIVLEETDKSCPECGKALVVKLGKYGKFLSCSDWPSCSYSAPVDDPSTLHDESKIDEGQLQGNCPKCKGKLVLKEGRFGKFISCANYPKCRFTKPYLEKIGMKCPECEQGEVVVKRSRIGKMFWGCSRYPDCQWASWDNPLEEKETR